MPKIKTIFLVAFPKIFCQVPPKKNDTKLRLVAYTKKDVDYNTKYSAKRDVFSDLPSFQQNELCFVLSRIIS